MINIIAPITTETSYGLSAIQICQELSKLTDISIFPIGQPQVTSNEIAQGLKNAEFFTRDARCIRIFHQFSLDQMVGRPEGLPIFELDKFTEREKHHIKSLDRVFVCSKWAQDIVEKECGIQSIVAPLGVGPEFFPVKTNNKRPTFLHIGKTEVRKNSRLIVDLFAEEFKNDDVHLFLSWQNIFSKDQAEWDRYAKAKLGDKVTIVPRLNWNDIPKLIQSADYYVSLSSAEGFNLPLLEAMACGKPCVGTYNTAQTEFLTEDNCYLVHTPNMEPAYDGVWFHGHGNWCKIDKAAQEQFKKGLRWCLSQNGNEAGIQTAKQFTWKKTAEILLRG